DKDIPFEKVAIFGCAVITGIGAIINTAQVKPGSTVAVVGLGGIGLNAIIGAHLAGASKIIALDINPNKFDMAKKLGATHTFDSSDEKVVDELKKLTNGGVNYRSEER